MRHLFFIILFLVFVLICGALLSYPVYKFLLLFTEVKFHKLIAHVSSICGLALFCIWLKYDQQLNRDVFGFIRSASSAIATQLLTGFIAGVIMIFVLACALLLLGIHQFEPDLEFNLAAGIWILARALSAGIMVGLLEETLYRGALLGGFLSRMKPLAAVLISSVIYSGVHFLRFRDIHADPSVSWFTGLQILSNAFYRFTDPAIIDAFLSLGAFGVLLAMARLKSGALYLCIGLHAGVVTMMKIVSKTTNYAPDAHLAFLVTEDGHLLGYLAFSWIILCIFIYNRYAFAHNRTNV